MLIVTFFCIKRVLFDFINASEESEMQQLGVKIGNIFEMSAEEQIGVSDSIKRMTAGIVQTHSVDRIMSNIASLWDVF